MTFWATHAKDHTENIHKCTGQKNLQCIQNSAAESRCKVVTPGCPVFVRGSVGQDYYDLGQRANTLLSTGATAMCPLSPLACIQ